MLVILCEDSSMGKNFWNTINKYCLDNQAKIYTSFGVDKMYSTLKSIPLSSKDKVLFAIDNIGDEKVRDIVRSLKNDARKRGYDSKITTYYCIEEVFLSFKYFSDWMKLSDEVKNNIWFPIFEFIIGRSSVDYSKEDIFRNRFPNENNREQLANSYLNALTYSARNGLSNSKGFWIHKAALGKCWYSDCKTGKGVPYVCNQNNYVCYLYEKGYNFTSKEKLEYFWNNSNLLSTVSSLSFLEKVCKGV